MITGQCKVRRKSLEALILSPALPRNPAMLERVPLPIPVWFKLVYTAFCAILIPNYLREYGPTNFLYFCDVALLVTLAGIWLDSPLLISAPAVGILIPQTVWVADYLAALAGFQLIGMTAYMFDPQFPLFTRFLSFFHFWLPFALLYLVTRTGYDKRGFALWTAISTILVIVCYVWMPPPPAPADNPKLPVNINYVYGMGEKAVQTWMPPLAWVSMLLVGLPALVYYPTHWALSKYLPR